MSDFKQIYHICTDALRRCMINPRIYISVLLATVLIEPLISPIRDFAGWAGVPSAPWVFPFLMQEYYIQTIILFGAVLLFCDAPFMNEGTPYWVIRSGRKNWFWGQIGYVFFASLIYFLLIISVSIMLLIPNVTLDWDWGKVLNTLSQTDTAFQIGTNKLDASLQIAYTPTLSMLFSLLMSWLNGVLIGMVMFLVNLNMKRIMGPVLGALLSTLPYFAIYSSNIHIIYFFAPGTWMNIMLLHTERMPSLLYAVVFLGIAISALIFLSYLSIRKRTIDVLPTI